MSAHDDGRARDFDAAADAALRLTDQDLADLTALYRQHIAGAHAPTRPTPMPRSATMLGRLLVAFLLLTIVAAFVVVVVIISAAALADRGADAAGGPVVDVIVGWVLVAVGVASLVVYGVWSALARRRGGAP